MKMKLMFKTCERCKKEFSTSKRMQKFCCRGCRDKSQTIDNKIPCPICGKKFKPHDGNSTFCSRTCYGVSRRKDKTKICPICGVSFQQRHYKQIYCSNSCSNKTKIHFMWEHTIPGKESEPNKRLGKLLAQLGFNIECTEFCLEGYYFDFKIGNILLELNPYPYHNSTRAPRFTSPKEKTYHYDKYKCAVDNGYKCIMIWDWTLNLMDMITNEQFHYEGEPQLHYYNPKTREHLVNANEDKSLIGKGFVEIRDCGKEIF